MADSRYKNNNAGDIVNGPDGAVRKQKGSGCTTV